MSDSLGTANTPDSPRETPIKHARDHQISVISENVFSGVHPPGDSHAGKWGPEPCAGTNMHMQSESNGKLCIENLRNKENLMRSEHKSGQWRRRQQPQSRCKRARMTPNLRKNRPFQANLSSQAKAVRSPMGADQDARETKRNQSGQPLVRGISEFQLFSLNKADQTKEAPSDEAKPKGIRKISKQLFNMSKDRECADFRTAKRIRKRAADLRLVRERRCAEKTDYHARIQRERRLLLSRREAKRKRPKRRTNPDSFLAGALRKMSFNSKLIYKNKLRLFFKNLRQNCFSPRESPSPQTLCEWTRSRAHVRLPRVERRQHGKKLLKIREISESPSKVLDAPGIVDDFYTHTQEVSSKGILFISLKNTVYSFNLANNKTQKIKTSFTNSPSSIKVGPSGGRVAIGDTRGNLNLIDIEKNCYLFQSKVHRGRLGIIDYLSPHVLVTGGKDSALNLIDMRMKPKRNSISRSETVR